jgi:O-methyltransferase
MQLVKQIPFNLSKRDDGEDWPMFGYTMIGTKRLSNIQSCICDILKNNVDGDYVECGVWRGGASIFARAALDEYGGSNRTVWLADSFEGMPARTADDMSDPDPDLTDNSYLAVSLEQVKANFARFDLLGDRVRFIKGWFSDTLPTAPIGKIAILRLDGDYYSSTMDALNALYDKVTNGGYIIIDDYNAFKSCKTAITEFCNKRQIHPALQEIDNLAVFWKKTAG